MDTSFRKHVRYSVKRMGILIKLNEISAKQLEIKINEIHKSIEDNQERIDECEDIEIVKYLHEINVVFRETKDEYEKAIRDIQLNSDSLEQISDKLNDVAYYDEDERKVTDKVEEPESDIIIAQKYYDEGNTFEIQENYDEALKKYAEAVNLNPKNAHYWSRRGFCEIQVGDYDEAIKSHNESVKLDPENAMYWHFKGFIELDHEEYPKALESYTKAVKYEKRNPFFWRCKAGIEHHLQKYHEALESISQSLEIEKDYHADLWEKARIEICLKEYDDAVTSYDLALQTIDKEIEENPHPNYKLELEQSFVEIKNDKEQLENYIISLKNDENYTTQYRPDYDDEWFTKRFGTEESTVFKINEDSLKGDLEYEFNEELEENYEDSDED